MFALTCRPRALGPVLHPPGTIETGNWPTAAIRHHIGHRHRMRRETRARFAPLEPLQGSCTHHDTRRAEHAETKRVEELEATPTDLENKLRHRSPLSWFPGRVQTPKKLLENVEVVCFLTSHKVRTLKCEPPKKRYMYIYKEKEEFNMDIPKNGSFFSVHHVW